MPTPFLPQLGMLMQKAGGAPPPETPLEKFIREQKEAKGNIFLPMPSAQSSPLPPRPTGSVFQPDAPTDFTPLPTNAGSLVDNRPRIGPAPPPGMTRNLPQTSDMPFDQRIQGMEDLVKMVGGMTPTPRNTPEVFMGGSEKPSLPGLYSRLLRGFEAVPAKQLHPNKIASMFQQVPEEAQFTGASKFAQGNTPVPTQQIVEHLRENPLQLGEKVLSDAPVGGPIEGPVHLQHGLNGDRYQLPFAEGMNVEPYFTRPYRGIFGNQGYGMPGETPLYNLEGPHASNSFGLTPEQVMDKIQKVRGLQSKLPPANPPEYSQYTLPGAVKGTNQERVISWEGPFNLDKSRPFDDIYNNPNFQSHAFNTPNTQVWSRSNIHETPNGPFKFLEEIQSDWHQKGKDKGYQSPEMFDKLNQRFSAQQGRPIQPELINQHMRMEGMLPDTPFKSSWPDLALKRELYDAAKNDLSGIAWTPGRVQNQRWDLGQVADALMFDPHPTQPGKGVLIGSGTNGNPFHYQIGGDSGHTLEDYVGKGMAEHLRTNPKTRIETKGLDVGGAGMRQFYDQEVPRKLEKLVGPLGGGKVEPVGFLPSTKEPRQPLFHNGSMEFPFRPGELDSTRAAGQTLLQGLKLTPELKRAILSKGFPLLSLGAAAFSPQLSKLQDAAKPLDTAPPKR